MGSDAGCAALAARRTFQRHACRGAAGVITDQLFFTGINLILAWSVYVVLLAGNLSFAQGAFMAIGCYASGLLTVKLGVPLIPAAIGGAVLSALLAMLIGWPALRVRGIYLIMVTIGVTFCVRVGLENFKLVGGVQGFGGMSGADLTTVLAAVLVIGVGLWCLSVSPLQRVLDAVREDDRVAESLGINAAWVKLAAFSIGAAIAAIGGALYGHFMNFVRPDNFDILVSIYVVLYVILGGVNNMFGPVLGAAIMTLLPEYFRVLAEWRPTIFGLVIVIMLLFRPEGLLSFRVITARLGRGRDT
ncbi:MAG: branched-chain amino acid ABC transporter permease [Betaproteobacteria bacterium]|nr:branched-chain amino acid ABC transporter permease [Betaproteobacteria bacterium]